MSKMILYFLCLAMLVACGGDNDDDDDNDVVTTNPPQEQEALDFSTRLNPNLGIAGVKCDGGETTTYGGQTYTCDRDEWLVTIDNVNTCDSEGRCTEVFVTPIVAEADFKRIVTAPEYAFFEIDPESPVTAEQQRILDQVYVRTNLNGDTEVVYRNGAPNE